MKLFLAFITVTYSSLTLACPDLSGTYPSCKLQGYYPDFDTKGLTISQDRNSEGKTIYHLATENMDGEISTTDLMADGQTIVSREMEDGVEFKISRTAACEANRVQKTEVIEVEDQEFAMQFDESYFLQDETFVWEIASLGETLATITCSK